jgi:glycerate 2-kinase
MIIKNRAQLLEHGNVEGRRAVLDILEEGLAAADPYENVRSILRIEDNHLLVGSDQIRAQYILPPASIPRPLPDGPVDIDLSKTNHIYVVGGGKAAQRMAQAIEDVLGDRITEGHINARKGDSVYLKRIEVTLAGHPLPDEDSVAGARRIYEIERSARRGDLVLLSESGGGSALMTLPAPGLTLEDLREVNRILYFGCGASMPTTNAVRNQLTIVRGRHPRNVGDATLIQISTPETPPDLRVHLTETPNGADPYQRATDILVKYGCWNKVPAAVRAFLIKRDPAYGPVTPQEVDGKSQYYFRVMGPEYMLEAAQRKASELGLRATILASSINDVEARAAGEIMAQVAQEIAVYGRPLAAPCVFLCGGELTVAVGEEKGLGGRNQEFALATAAVIADSKRIVVASADSDGADGPTDVAGAIVDGYTVDRAHRAGVDLEEELRRHNTHVVLRDLGDTVYTGVLKTNVRDLRVVYVGPA